MNPVTDALRAARRLRRNRPLKPAGWNVAARRGSRHHPVDVGAQEVDQFFHFPAGGDPDDHALLCVLVALQDLRVELHERHQRYADEECGDHDLNERQAGFGVHGEITSTRPVAAVTCTRVVAPPATKVNVIVPDGPAAPEGLKVTWSVPVAPTLDGIDLG